MPIKLPHILSYLMASSRAVKTTVKTSRGLESLHSFVTRQLYVGK